MTEAETSGVRALNAKLKGEHGEEAPTGQWPVLVCWETFGSLTPHVFVFFGLFAAESRKLKNARQHMCPAEIYKLNFSWCVVFAAIVAE